MDRDIFRALIATLLVCAVVVDPMYLFGTAILIGFSVFWGFD